MRRLDQCFLCSSLCLKNIQLHIGLGAFHRAHQAAFLHRLHQAGDRRWRLVGGNIRDDAPTLMRDLSTAGGRYTLETISPSGHHRFELIESIDEIIPWSADHRGLVATAALADTRIISFTVTESGYYLNAAGGLNAGHEALANDIAALEHGRPVCTIFGAVTLMLRARRAAGSGPVTLLSCDNLRHNGTLFGAALLEFLALTRDVTLAPWVRLHCSWPNSMVDRITPRPDGAVRERVRAAVGRDDPCAVMSEEFIQWVMEDDFIAGRPDWGRVGTQMVRSVQPFEEAKIRMLNGSHSAIAWAGAVAGHQWVSEAVVDPPVFRMAFAYITDAVMPCLRSSAQAVGFDLAAYRDSVLERFRNAYLRDTLQRVSQDSFSKFAGFIAPTIRDRLAVGADIGSVALMPAQLLQFLLHWAAGELPFSYQEQAVNEAAARRICAAPDPVAALCGEVALFGDLAGNAALTAAVRAVSVSALPALPPT